MFTWRLFTFVSRDNVSSLHSLHYYNPVCSQQTQGLESINVFLFTLFTSNRLMSNNDIVFSFFLISLCMINSHWSCEVQITAFNESRSKVLVMCFQCVEGCKCNIIFPCCLALISCTGSHDITTWLLGFLTSLRAWEIRMSNIWTVRGTLAASG